VLSQFTHTRDVYHVTVNIDPERSTKLLDAAVALGLSRAFIVRGRGVLRKQKWGPFTLPSISPLFDILHWLVPVDRLEATMATLVTVGNLQHFGAGSIFASRVTDLWYTGTNLVTSSTVPALGQTYEFQRDLVAISCIAQLEHAEEIAHEAMLAGSPSPTISYGYGHGIRDRLGPFLQLTINPKKEFVELVVGAEEADRVFEAMVEAGHLDQPAQGFISTRPIDVGLINTVSFQHKTPYPATMEQIIKAIDQLQGNTNWRKQVGLSGSTAPRRKTLTNLVTLNCIVKRGFGDICSLAAMESGAGGTSTYFANASPLEHLDPTSHEGTDEREIITLSVAPELVAKVVSALTDLAELAGTPVLVFSQPAPQALTYLK
jgi:nitrogen regulatory protein PII